MIKGFQGKYRFLSNFWIKPDGSHVEGEYQQSKCKYEIDKKRFIGLTPGQAKRLGRQVEMREDWYKASDDIMRVLIRAKFLEHSMLRNMLLRTDEEELEETNTWHDNLWGNCACTKCRATPGQNKLGKILMQVREELNGNV